MKTRLGIVWTFHDWKPGKNCHLETLLCPGCGHLQTATVPHTKPEPYRLHRCGHCGCLIGWERWRVFEGNPAAIFHQNQKPEAMQNIGCEHPNPVTYRASNGITKGCTDCGQLLGGIWDGQPFGCPVDPSECVEFPTDAPGIEGQAVGDTGAAPAAPSAVSIGAAPVGCFVCADLRENGDWKTAATCAACDPPRPKAAGMQTSLF